MGTKKILVCFAIILFASAIVLAEDSSTETAGSASNSSQPVAPAHNSTDSGPSKSPGFGSGSHTPSRHKRSPEQNHGRAAPRRASCSGGIRGSRCRSCHEVIECLSGNRAVIRRCSGPQRYCNRGRCSSTPGGKCRRSSTSSSSSTSTTEGSVSDTTTTTESSTSTSTDSTSSTDSSSSSSSSTSSTSSTSTTTEADYSE